MFVEVTYLSTTRPVAPFFTPHVFNILNHLIFTCFLFFNFLLNVYFSWLLMNFFILIPLFFVCSCCGMIQTEYFDSHLTCSPSLPEMLFVTFKSVQPTHLTGLQAGYTARFSTRPFPKTEMFSWIFCRYSIYFSLGGVWFGSKICNVLILVHCDLNTMKSGLLYFDR